MKVTGLAEALGDVLFPRGCVACGDLVETSPLRHVCSACTAQIDFAEGAVCSICGHPFAGLVVGARVCPHCEGLEPAFARGSTAVLCRGPARALVHELKYRGGRYVLQDVETLFGRAPKVLELARDAVLVPVPLHPRKERERGYNQSVLLAERLARAAGGKTRVEKLLERVMDTPSQTAFDRRARLANLKNAFALRSDAAITGDHHYVLVDDVFTTGSTLNSCARVLRHAGILNLDVVTFGHG